MPSFSPWIAATSALVVAGLATSAPRAPTKSAPLPPIHHVFVIMLENQQYDTTFGPATPATYLADTLVGQGALLTHYYGIGHASLDNYIAIVSGIGPNRQTQSDCPHFDDFVETGMAADGQPIGTGCVYPAHVKTVANQLMNKDRSWKGYMEDMGSIPTRESATCAHAPIGGIDPTERAVVGDMYAAKHDPFVYFHSIIDSDACDKNVVPIKELETALKSARRTPNFSFIVPNLCHDGHDRPCKNGEPGGLVSANAFLQHWVPLITSSPAFRDDGMLIITFDEAWSIDATACCDEHPGPNTLAPGVNGPGGGRIGAVVLSPFIAPGTVSDTPYNHYSLLRTVEDIFGLDHLGFAGRDSLASFGTDVFTRPW